MTTHSMLLVERLRRNGFKAEYLKEPTSGPIGELIRTYLRRDDSLHHELLALLFAADRYWNYYLSEKPISNLKSAGYVVVSDRYKYSSIAYQGAFTSIEWVWEVNSRVPHSDIIVFLDVPVDLALKRIESRVMNGFVREGYEKRELLEKIYHNYDIVLKRAEEEGVRVLRIYEVEGDKELSVEDVNEEIYLRLAGYLQ